MERTQTNEKSGIHIDAPMAQNIQKSTYLARLPFTLAGPRKCVLAVRDALGNRCCQVEKVGYWSSGLATLNMGEKKSW